MLSEVLWKTALVKEEAAQAMAEQADVPIKVARWLCARGIPANDALEWLEPGDEVYHSPFAFADMDVAVHRILQAVVNEEQIAVVGDYDVDGVTASAILASTLSFVGAQWICDIPHRIDDGYGLSEGIVERLAEQDVGLLVTVDNGIRSVEAVSLATDLGLDVIVTDHHEPGPDSPTDAVAIVHWSRAQADVNLNHLSGAGVAWKLSEALLTTWGANDNTVVQHAARHRQWLKALAALGALADVMPMHTENRRLIREGMTTLAISNHPGWQALCEVARVEPSEVNDKSLLWRITPRLNAAGRMDSADIAFRLLMAEAREEADELAQQIEQLNQLRRAETDKSVRDAKGQCEELLAKDENLGGIVVAGPWAQGVVGIVAARLVDVYKRPVIVLADTDAELLLGSGRSSGDVSLYKAMEQCTPSLHHFGGHDAAVGCGVERGKLEDFRRDFATACSALNGGREDSAIAQQVLVADDFLPLGEANLELLTWVERFAPYGPDNPAFTFYVGPLEIQAVDKVGSGRHIRLRVREADVQTELIWFNAPEGVEHWGEGMLIGAVVELGANTWRNVKKAQLRVVEAKRLRRVLTRSHFGTVYRLLRARRQMERKDVVEVLPDARPEEIETVMEAFVELGFAQVRESAYHVVERVASRDLRESRCYHEHLFQATCE